MLLRIDAMTMTIEHRDHGLAHAFPIRTVHRSAGERGDERALDLLLKIEHGVVALSRDLAAEAREFAPRRTREKIVAPAPQSDRNRAAHAAIQANEIRERF